MLNNVKSILKPSILVALVLSASAHAEKKSAKHAEPSAPAPVASYSESSSSSSSGTSWLKGEHLRGLTVSGVTTGATTGTIGYAHFLDAENSIRADFGVKFDKPDGGSLGMAFSLDLGYRSYVANAGLVKVFTQPGIFIAKASTPAGFSDELSVAATYAIGAEYFINPNFSIGASTGAALTFATGFKNITLGTGTSALFASLYW